MEIMLLERGSKGELVKRWQSFVGVKPDGDFGDDTDTATKAFQSKHGLRPDGKVGEQTLQAAVKAGFQLPSSLTPKKIPQITGTVSSKLVRMNVKAPNPFLSSVVVPSFNAMRQETFEKSGYDFWAKSGDMWRPASLRTNKAGVAFKSNHKTGRANDYDQTHPALVIVSEPINGRQFFRTYLKCKKQDGSMGLHKSVRDFRGYNVKAYLVEVTAIAEKHGWLRIPAHAGWQRSYNRMEFWHYQNMSVDGKVGSRLITWEEGMRQIS